MKLYIYIYTEHSFLITLISNSPHASLGPSAQCCGGCTPRASGMLGTRMSSKKHVPGTARLRGESSTSMKKRLPGPPKPHISGECGRWTIHCIGCLV